ncbi:acetyl-CoA C-acetyltransferase [bacterium]|nr:acetyl-CoA C-acetyltransferase [bacterium]
MLREVVIVSAARTPIGSFNGSLSSVSAPKLGAVVAQEVVKRAGISKEEVDEVIMGCVLPAGLGQAPARQVVIFGGFPKNVGALTINKVCGSGLKAVMLAAQSIACGDADVIIAGGMENMSQAPHLLKGAREGFRLGNAQMIDSMINDGLWDVYNNFHMGNAAELCAKECNITRENQDEFAINSYKKALESQKNGTFKDEIVAVEITSKKGNVVVDTDEEPSKVNFDKVPTLRPAFDKEGTVTAANASSINDGAAAVLVMSLEKAKSLGLKPMAKIVAQASAGKNPEWFTKAPIDAIGKVLAKAKLTKDEIDLFEINEAFAVVSLITNRELGLDNEKINVNGGAIALGHPIGASGARILTTLLYEMQKRNAKRGLATLCIGGGEASALIVEKI